MEENDERILEKVRESGDVRGSWSEKQGFREKAKPWVLVFRGGKKVAATAGAGGWFLISDLHSWRVLMTLYRK